MRTYTVTIADNNQVLTYRVAFRDLADRAMAVTRLRRGAAARPIAISSIEARAAIAAAMAQIPVKTAPRAKRKPGDSDKPYAALEALARVNRLKETA